MYKIKKKGSTPWYRVRAIDQNEKKIGVGWINSTALLGQNIFPYK